MILLAGTVRIAQGKRGNALAHLQRMVEASRTEPGCRAYAFAFDVLDDHLIRIFEAYDDQPALDAHRASPHFAAWRTAWPEAGIGDRGMTRYDVDGAPKPA
jgi:quinol monooxygenase YgiN